jgi:hypothetical protein
MKRTREEIIRMNNFLKFIAKDYHGFGFDQEINNLQAAINEIEVEEEHIDESIEYGSEVIIKAFNTGYSNGFMQKFKDGEDYFNKTFKK